MRVLFGISSVGLGHATRSLRIAQRLRELAPGCTIQWLCAPPAAVFLRARGELVFGTPRPFRSLTPLVEAETHNGTVHSWLALLRRAARIVEDNRSLVAEAISAFDPDILVSDEFWEILGNKDKAPLPRSRPLVFLTDFLRYSVRTWNPLTYLALQYVNRQMRRALERVTTLLYVGHPSTLTEERWYGVAGPPLNHWAARHARILGPVLSHDPAQLPPRSQLRRQLGLPEQGHVIVGTVGGTGAGALLLLRLVDAHRLLRRAVPAINTVLIGWPPQAPQPSAEGLVVRGFESRGYEWLAAADTVVTTAGLSTLLEATSSGARLVVAPLQNHFEQQANARLFQKIYPVTVISQWSQPATELARILERVLSGPTPNALHWDDASRPAADAICVAFEGDQRT